eukprot:759823_1
MDEDKSQTISFEEFWKGFKAQAQAMKQQELHQEMNEQLLELNTGSDDSDSVTDNEIYENTHTYTTHHSYAATPMSFEQQLDAIHNKRHSYRAKLLGGRKHQRIKSLTNKTWNQDDKNNIFRVMKRHLKKTKMKKRDSKLLLGRV